MAVPFFNGGRSSAMQPGGAGKTTGYSPQLFLDEGILTKLRENGFILTPTSYTADFAMQSFRMIERSVLGASIPALQDAATNVYILDERQNVYLLERSRIRPETGTPTGAPLSPTMSGPTPPPQPPLVGGTGVMNGGIMNGGTIAPPLTGTVIGSGKIYSQFTTDDVVPNQQEIVTRALWSNNVGNLTTFFTSSIQTTIQKTYYYEIYNSSSIDDCGSEPQFSIAYGHILGSGSEDLGGQIEDTPSRAIYGQYRLLCLEPDQESFVIDGTATDQIYAINVNRARMREFLDEGNIEINIAHLSGSEYIAGGGDPDTHTGSAVTLAGNDEVLRLIDDSKINPATITQAGEVYNIVSGTIEDGVYNPSNPHVYGQLYRRKGIIVLDANRLDASASFATVTGREVNGDNAFKLFTAISGAALLTDDSGDPLGFQGRGAERVKSTHYFIRAKNSEYNFSNNPTFVTGSEGDLRHPEMINDPSTYITTIGLYNMNKELIAVAKLSQAVRKSFKEEALIKVKLDF